MTFANPKFLYNLIFLLPVLILFFFWARRQQQNALNRLGNQALVQRLTASVNWRGRRWQTLLWFVALIMVVVAIARPQWGTETQEAEQQGIEVMIALDVSNSMLAQDIKPDRLSRAKMEIADLMTRLGGNEIGLVLFSGASFIQFPLTADYNTAMTFLDNARPQVISKQGTNVSDALKTAMSGFDLNRPSQKVIVLITDGEAHDGDTLAMAQQAADQGVRIYTIGFGSPDGEPIPDYDDAGNVIGYKRDMNGDVVLSQLDETTLAQVAKIGNGVYYRANADGGELTALVTELDMLQKSALSTKIETWGIERFQYFLWVALIALALSEFIPDSISRSKKKAPSKVSKQQGAPFPAISGR
jgi:Ca-activated chloride channel family protein